MKKEDIIALLKREIAPAVGCTEPVCVALSVAKATEMLGVQPEQVEVKLSANILKNAMGVGIPGTGMTGLPIAIALGALIGKSADKLELLKNCTPESVERGKKFIAEQRIKISLKENIREKLYSEAICTAEDRQGVAIIAGEHARFVYAATTGKVLPDTQPATGESQLATDGLPPMTCRLNMRKIHDFSMTCPIDDISFILESRSLNIQAAANGLKGRYGHELGKMLSRPLSRGIFGESIFSHILSSTASACDARMGGSLIPVMSNSGSGNQGICATNPVVVFAEENHNTEEELIRGLVLSHLTAIYIKQSLGTLSALCGCVVASTGASCGITYLMGGSYEQITYAVKNMIANLTGMVCDGAKPSCALKVTSGVSTAVLSAILAIQHRCVTSVEGIIDNDVDESIKNLTSIGADAMNDVDKKILDIMINKKG
jgi:L-cysteine desulfidase